MQAGYREVDIATLDRTSLLDYYAKVLSTQMAYVPAKEEQDEDEDEDGDGDSEEEAEFAESKADVQHTAGGDMSVQERRLEEQRLQQEEQRLQREQQQKQMRMQLEEQRLQCEQQWEEQCRQREFEERQ